MQRIGKTRLVVCGANKASTACEYQQEVESKQRYTSQPSTDQLVSNTGEELLKFGQASSRRGDLSWNNGKQRAEHMRRTTWLTSTLEVARFKQRNCWLN